MRNVETAKCDKARSHNPSDRQINTTTVWRLFFNPMLPGFERNQALLCNSGVLSLSKYAHSSLELTWLNLGALMACKLTVIALQGSAIAATNGAYCHLKDAGGVTH